MSTNNELDMSKNAVFLTDGEITLRTISEDNIPKLMKWINDPEVRQFLNNVRPVGYEQEKAWTENLHATSDKVVLGIFTEDGTFIGNTGLHEINHISGTATTGAVIGEKEYLNKGYGSKAKKLILDYAFNTLNLRKINSSVLGFNGRSQAYLKKSGYKVEGVLKDQIFRNGEYHDEILMAIFREDWIKQNKKD